MAFRVRIPAEANGYGGAKELRLSTKWIHMAINKQGIQGDLIPAEV